MSLIYSAQKHNEQALYFTLPFAPGLVIDCMPFENCGCLRKTDMAPAGLKNRTIPALPPLPVRLQRLSILPNNRCNFHCSYCYAAWCRTSGELDKNTMLRAVECFFSLPERRDISVSFLGGGEPLLSWNTVKDAIVFIRSLSSSVPINIVTNGSIITDEMIDFYLKHQISLTVSFEVLKDIQDLQRGEYDLVDANIRKLLAQDVPLKIRSILTDRNIHRIGEMAAAVAERYSKITRWLVEPVSAWSYFDDTASAERFWQDYRQGIEEMKSLPVLEGISWNSLMKRFFSGSSTCYCDGEFVVMPSGEIGLCHRVSSPQEKLGREWLWGFFNGEKYELDFSRAEKFYQLPEKMKDLCTGCPAFACCGGNCRVMAGQASEAYIKSHCSFIRQCFFDHIKTLCARHWDVLQKTGGQLPLEFKLYD